MKKCFAAPVCAAPHAAVQLRREHKGLIALLALACRLAGDGNLRASSADTLHTLTHDGIERTYLLHLPSAYDGLRPTPLVLSLHGGGGNAESQRRVDRFDKLADEKGFIVVYPNGTTGRFQDAVLTWNGGTCCGYAAANRTDDVGFIRALIAELQSNYNIDPKRIYATGSSNGGIMSYRLACDASDLFAAIGPVAGTQNYDRCAPTEPVSLIHFHGTDDAHLPYDGGIGDDSLTGVSYKSVDEALGFWLDFNQCDPAPATETFEDVRHDTYSGCSQGTAVELHTILGGTHAWPGSDGPAWPGGDEPTHTISATETLWAFFAAHPKP